MTEQEEDLIYRMYKLVGDRWALIAGRIPGRKAEEIERMVKSAIRNQGVTRDPPSSQLEACTGERLDIGGGPMENGLWATLSSSGPEGSGPRTSSCLEVVLGSLENSTQHRPTFSGPGSWIVVDKGRN
ncbi:hypothetical protein Ancab_036870 [Ancistrocladus abbreviatus]